MYTISDTQIDYILNDIRARGVEMEDLQYNLLDHVCCIIEQNLEVNGNFEDFYRKTIKTFYKQELWEIEEETISLQLFKHYYTMKKIMIGSGFAATVFMIAGILFKFMHWPGAAAMIILGIGTSSLIFLPLLLTLRIKEKSKSRDKVIVTIGTLSGMLFSLGILFKVMHWPYANMMGMTSIAIMLLLYLPISFITGIRNPETKVNTIVSSIIIIMGCGLFLTLVNSRPSIQVRNTIAYINQQSEDSYSFISEQNDQTYDLLMKDSLINKAKYSEIKRKSDTLCTMIENLKRGLVSFNEDKQVTAVNYKDITDPDNYGIPSRFMFNNEGVAKKDLKEIKASLAAFIEFTTTNFDLNAKKLIDMSDQPSVHFDGTEPWEVSNFYNTSISLALHNLTRIQLDIRIIESQCLSAK